MIRWARIKDIFFWIQQLAPFDISIHNCIGQRLLDHRYIRSALLDLSHGTIHARSQSTSNPTSPIWKKQTIFSRYLTFSFSILFSNIYSVVSGLWFEQWQHPVPVLTKGRIGNETGQTRGLYLDVGYRGVDVLGRSVPMKPFTWVHHAVQALATEGTGHSGISQQSGQNWSYFSQGSTYNFSSYNNSHNLRSRQSRIPPTFNLMAQYDISAPADILDTLFEPESPPPLPSPGFDATFVEYIINARTEFDVQSFESFERDSEKYTTDSEYCSSEVSEDQSKIHNTTHHLKEVSATIFQSSPSVPISIIVTTPLDESPDSLANPQMLQRNVTSFPLATLNSDHLNNVDQSLLMPPTDPQLDSRKLRKAQEFREIRRWLITFLNSKGDRFPRKVRLRMMELYCIREFDLAPEIIARFNAEVQNEAVALEQQDEGMDDAQSLSILGAAFRSQIEEVTPRKEKVLPLPVSPSWQRQGSPPKKAETKRAEPKKPESVKPKKESRPVTPVKQEIDMDLVPSWLAPLISTSASSRDSLMADQQYLKRAYSAPNLKAARPQLNSPDSAPSIPGLRPRGSTVTGEDVQRKPLGIKRSNFISGAFGVMREAMRRPSKRDLRKKVMG